MDKTVLEVRSFDEAASDDREFWHRQSAEARLRHALELRRLNYGSDRVSGRLQRVLEIAQLAQR